MYLSPRKTVLYVDTYHVFVVNQCRYMQAPPKDPRPRPESARRVSLNASSTHERQATALHTVPEHSAVIDSSSRPPAHGRPRTAMAIMQSERRRAMAEARSSMQQMKSETELLRPASPERERLVRPTTATRNAVSHSVLHSRPTTTNAVSRPTTASHTHTPRPVFGDEEEPAKHTITTFAPVLRPRSAPAMVAKRVLKDSFVCPTKLLLDEATTLVTECTCDRQAVPRVNDSTFESLVQLVRTSAKQSLFVCDVCFQAPKEQLLIIYVPACIQHKTSFPTEFEEFLEQTYRAQLPKTRAIKICSHMHLQPFRIFQYASKSYNTRCALSIASLSMIT